MTTAIIGKGVWGKSIASLLDHNNQPYRLYGREEQVNADIIFLAVPTESIKSVLPFIQFSPETIIINTSKGMQKETGKLPFQLVEQEFGKDVNYFSLLGPGFANQVTSKMLTMVNLGYQNSKNLKEIKALMTTPYFKLVETPYINAIEIIAAFKNVYAILCGILAELGYKENTNTAFILLAVQELYMLLNKRGISYDEQIVPEMLGDMMLTCTSVESRNYKFGMLLTRKTIEDALKELKTVEGYHTSLYLESFQKQNEIDLPLASLVQKIIEINNPQNVKNLIAEYITKI